MLWQITEFTVCLYRWESGPDFPFVLLSTRPLCLCFMYAWKWSLEYLLLNQIGLRVCMTKFVHILYISIFTSLNILKKISSTSAHHLPLSQQANREPQISFSLFFPPCLSLNPNVIPFYLTQLLQAEATLRECAQHLSPSCC